MQMQKPGDGLVHWASRCSTIASRVSEHPCHNVFDLDIGKCLFAASAGFGCDFYGAEAACAARI